VTAAISTLYPENQAGRDHWIVAQRAARSGLDPWKPYAYLVEEECAANGSILPVATVFLTNRECPWRCVMCDLWKNTLPESVPAGAIPAQLDYALAQLPAARTIKLYNSGSFFDPHAIPIDDYKPISERLRSFDRVIVECHPSLVGERCLAFRDLLEGKLEVAMGLETAHPEVLEKLNKRMTLEQFSSAAAFLHTNSIDMRAFIIVQPPFMRPTESLYWAQRSIDFAFDCKATAASLIPARGGNGAMEALAGSGDFVPPTVALMEAAMGYGLNLKRGRVFVDLWDLRQTDGCAQCYSSRVDRLHAMNLQQTEAALIRCHLCGGAR
jgi:radical SAM enzyme (TIGR01210 family)